VRGPDGKNTIAVDAAVAPAVIRLFERYAGGDCSLSELSTWAAEVGLRSKRGNALSRSTIHALLQNPLYVGELDWMGTVYPGRHQALISRELREQVLARLGERALVSRATQFREFAFSGLVRCATCAAEGGAYLLVGEIHKERYVYYTCQECKRRDRVVYHREASLARAFLSALERLWVAPEVLASLRSALRASHAALVEARDRELGQVRRQLEVLQQRLDRAYDDRLDGRLSVEDYERRAQGWREEQGRLRRQLEAHAGADQATVEQGLALLDLATMAIRLWDRQEPAEQRKISARTLLSGSRGSR
jgi:hypothetical protein